jgi:hypothetical protein
MPSRKLRSAWQVFDFLDTGELPRKNDVAMSLDSVQTALENRVDLLARWLVFCTGLVVLGLMFEYGGDLAEKWRPHKKLGNEPSFLWIPLWIFMGGILVVGGVAGELFAEFFASRAENNLRQFSDAANAELTKKAADADNRSKELEHENLKLQAEIAPRRLTTAQQLAIAENCSKFANLFRGKQVKLVSYSLDTEAFVLAEQVLQALKMKPCAMTVDDEAMSITPMMGTVIFGISVFGSDSELAKKIAWSIGSNGGPIGAGFLGYDPTTRAMRAETPNSLRPHEATILVGLKLPDRNTINELDRILPTTK